MEIKVPGKIVHVGLYVRTASWKPSRPIAGLHDTVRTYTRTILPRRLVSFLYGAV